MVGLGRISERPQVCVCVFVEHMECSCRDKCCLTGLSGPVDSWLYEDRLLSSDSVHSLTDLLIMFPTFTLDLARPLPLTAIFFFSNPELVTSHMMNLFNENRGFGIPPRDCVR